MKKMILLVVMLLLTIGIMRSQVTIGSLEPPRSGSLLDLKETSEGASTRGLLLPRVSLESTTSPLPTMTSHVQGMFVYNTATVNDVTPGIYYNDGSKWKCLYSEANNGLTMSSDTVQLGGVLKKSTKIDNTSYVLEISGTTGITIISSPFAIASGSPDAGRVLKSRDASGNAYWDNIVPTAVAGKMYFGNPKVDRPIKAAPKANYSYTGYSVSCPPGRSMIYAGLNLRNTCGFGGYVTVGLSTDSTSYTQFNPNLTTPNVQGYAPDLSGFALLPNFNIGGGYTASLGEVTFYVNNTGTGNIALYLWALVQGSSDPANSAGNLMSSVTLSSSASENFILCSY